MIEIVIAACSLVQGQMCKEEKLTYMEEIFTPQQCMFYGQVEIAKWVESHPNWKVQKWTCRIPKEEKKI